MSTTIRISRENKNKLMNIGCKNESFEDIIMKLYHIRNCALIKELTDNTTNFKTELLRVFELIGYDMSNIDSDYLIRTIQEDSPENITEAILDAYCMCECLEYLPYYW